MSPSSISFILWIFAHSCTFGSGGCCVLSPCNPSHRLRDSTSAMYSHGLSQGPTKSTYFRWGGKKGGRAWTRWPSEVPFSPSCCMILWMNGFLMWVLPLGERAGREYFPCKGRSDMCSSFTYLLSPFQWALTAVWFYTSEFWPHKQQEEVKISTWKAGRICTVYGLSGLISI